MRCPAQAVGVFLVAALVGVGCSGGLESPAETLRRNSAAGEGFGYVLDAAPVGYELCAISTPSALSLRADAGASLHVYADGSLDDAYAGPLLGVALFEADALEGLDLGATEDVVVLGGPGRLGTADGLLVASLPASAGRVLTYEAGPAQTVQLMARNDATTDLVSLAESVVIRGGVATIAPDALPDGFVGLGNIYELEGQAQFRFSLDYQTGVGSDGSLQDQLTLLGSTGNAASLEAFRFRAAESGRTQVNGHAAVRADIGAGGEGPFVVSWMPADDLVLRVFSFVIPPEELLDIASSARQVAGDEWDKLRETFEPSVCER